MWPKKLFDLKINQSEKLTVKVLVYSYLYISFYLKNTL